MSGATTGTSLRERLLAADDLGSEVVEIEEWEEWLKGDKLHVRGLTAGEVEEIGREVNEGSLENIMARLAVKVTTNGDGAGGAGTNSCGGLSPSRLLKRRAVLSVLVRASVTRPSPVTTDDTSMS